MRSRGGKGKRGRRREDDEGEEEGEGEEYDDDEDEEEGGGNTHTHINNVKDLDFLLEKCKENRVTELIAISTDINSSRENIKISKKYENIFCAVGFHPCELNPKSQGEISELISIASMDECKAIGEIGLDFFHEPFNKEMQLDLFNSQFTIAEELNKPVIIHCRDAYPETISFIESRRPKVDFVFHCFTENLTTAKKIIDLGGYLSFTGIITFKKSIELLPLKLLLFSNENKFLIKIFGLARLISFMVDFGLS